MMEDEYDNLTRAESDLMSQGISIAHLKRSAEAIPHLLDPSHTEMSLVEFHSCAGRLPFWQDFDVGALILEAVADGLQNGQLKEVLYRHALYRAQLCASAATAGGEGLARMMHVKELMAKQKAQPSAAYRRQRGSGRPPTFCGKKKIEMCRTKA